MLRRLPPPDDVAFKSLTGQTEVDSVGLVARAFALALSGASIRSELRDAIAASSFPEQKLDFQDFVHKSTSSPLIRRAASKVGWDEPRLRGLIERFPALELYLPVEEQRAAWTGDDNIVVLGTMLRDHDVRRAGQKTLIAFDTHGDPVTISMTSVPQQTTGGGTGGGGGGGSGGIDGWYVDQLRMVYAEGYYDGVPFGHPEFEVWLAACNGTDFLHMSCTVPHDAAGLAPCAGEDYASSNPRDFNYDDPPNLYADGFLVAQGNRQLLDGRYAGEVGGIENTGVIIVMEDDEGRCPTTPALDEFGGGGDDWIAHLALYAGSNVMDFSNSSGSDPAKVRVVWAASKTY